MRPNGFIIVIDLALKHLQNPYLNDYRKTLILGAFRENVYYTPGIRLVSLNPSISHFYRPGIPGGIIPFCWPGPRFMADWHFRKALREHSAGRYASAFVQLGRVSHLLTDMACPVHAQSVFHSTDPFEWCVEAMKERWQSVRVYEAPNQTSRPSELVESLANFTQDFPAEKTNNPWGLILKHFGIRKKLKTQVVRQQADVLIPRAAEHTISLFKLFLKQIQIPNTYQASLPETLRSLQMPADGLVKWFRQIVRFCNQHGGKNHYAEILDLMQECTASLQSHA